MANSATALTSWSLFPLGMDDAWLLPAMCLAAFVIISFFGRYLPQKGSWLAILAIGLGFVLTFFIFGDLVQHGPATLSQSWLAIPALPGFGGFNLYLSMTVDQLCVLMLFVVALVALMVQVFSIGYMHGDPRYGWYFAAHSLFAAAMLGLVLADNFLILYICWELVGLCSYLLIGFWWERRSAAEAAKKAFVTTRIGDVGFLIGILLLWRITGSFAMSDNFAAVAAGRFDPLYLTIAAILLFSGAMGKSAQFPLHVWLPDAMEGPTPVSALIHAATMVAAGVYMVARIFPLFAASSGAMTLIAYLGLITTLMAGSMALVMFDVKRVLAYSTISQLGFMMVSLGSFGYTAGMFHLFTHAFFKALLFLGSGSLSHAYDSFDMRVMGGAARKMPITALTFGIGALAMAGLPPFAGFFSKDEILLAVQTNQHPIFFWLIVLSALMSAIYMARVTIIAFFGEPRDHHLYEHAHESPASMTIPLIILAVLAVVAGWVVFDWAGPLFGLPSAYAGIGSYLVEPGAHAEHYHANWDLMGLSTVVSVGGLLIGGAFYSWRIFSAESLARRLGWVYQLLVNKYYMDDIYQWLINNIALMLARFIALFDRMVINDIGVNGAGLLATLSGLGLRYSESGKMYQYAIVFACGAATLVIAAIAVLV